jgi:hypothetical protein
MTDLVRPGQPSLKHVDPNFLAAECGQRNMPSPRTPSVPGKPCHSPLYGTPWGGDHAEVSEFLEHRISKSSKRPAQRLTNPRLDAVLRAAIAASSGRLPIIRRYVAFPVAGPSHSRTPTSYSQRNHRTKMGKSKGRGSSPALSPFPAWRARSDLRKR